MTRLTAADRWDGRSVHAFEGTYGDYLLAKVSKVFPELGAGVIKCADRASLAAAEGSRLDPVLTGGRTEAATPVL